MDKHDVKVEERQTQLRAGPVPIFQAQCECGWQSEWFATDAEAEGAGNAHREA